MPKNFQCGEAAVVRDGRVFFLFIHFIERHFIAPSKVVDVLIFFYQRVEFLLNIPVKFFPDVSFELPRVQIVEGEFNQMQQKRIDKVCKIFKEDVEINFLLCDVAGADVFHFVEGVEENFFRVNHVVNRN